MDNFEDEVRARKEHELEVLLSKHRDYGPTNIANAPGGALNGLRVRLHDKLARVNNLVDSGAEPEHEALIDTALDIANYGTIMALVLSGQWPGVETRSATKMPVTLDELLSEGGKYVPGTLDILTPDGEWHRYRDRH